MGTGFVIKEKTVVTNFHYQSGEELLFQRITHLSALDDLAVLEVENYKGPFLTLNPLSNIEEFLSGGLCIFSFKVICDNVYIPAFPMGEFSEIEGKFIISLDALLLYSLETQFYGELSGASGSPVLNEKGEVIGIFSSSNANDLFAIPVNILSALLQGPALPSTENPENLIREERAHLRVLVKQRNVRALNIWSAWSR